MATLSQLETTGEAEHLRQMRQANDLKRHEEMLGIVSSAFDYFDERAKADSPKMRKGSFQYIAYDLGMFLKMILDLKEILALDPHYHDEDPASAYRPIRFLEVGCGIGRNLFLLKHAKGLNFATVHGIDIVPEYLQEARRLYQLDENVIQADALEFDYTSYDVIYFYRPFEDEAMEMRFEQRIVDQLRPGGYVLNGLGFETELPMNFEPTEHWRIWRKAESPS